jgi:hypothetical protein
MDDFTLSDLTSPTGLGLSPQSLLNELKGAFPLRPAQLGDKLPDLYYAGGQQSVLEWIENRLEEA